MRPVFSPALLRAFFDYPHQMKVLFLVAAFLILYLMYKYARIEGFDPRLNVSPDLFKPSVTPGGTEEVSDLSPGGARDPAMEKIIESPGLPAMSVGEAESHWGEMTSQRCYKSDIGESLKPTRNYLQRTNNYIRSHPDDCSAPNHEFVGTFYKPFDGVGRTPAAGTHYPPSTQCAPIGF
jgi:hypothetical protein